MFLEIITLQFISPNRSIIVEASLMFQAVGFVIVFNSFNSNYSKNSNNSKKSGILILLKKSKNSATLLYIPSFKCNTNCLYTSAWTLARSGVDLGRSLEDCKSGR